ncbi:hypothetical protein BH11CYA1_BH11CYA1_32570 [soil metagenome]
MPVATATRKLTHKLALRRARATLGKWLKKSNVVQGDKLLALIMVAGAQQVLNQDQLNSELNSLTSQYLLNQLRSDLGLAESATAALNLDSNLDLNLTSAAALSLSKLFEGPEYLLLFSQVHGLSDLFEVYSINQRKLATAKVQTADKNTSTNDQALFSQIYTPPQVVQAMVDYLVVPLLDKANTVEAIKGLSMLDPCCGSGNFLIASTAQFYKAYQRFHLPDQEICRLIIEHNIVGVDIDDKALSIARFAITVQLLNCMKSKDVVANQISCLHNASDVSEAALGSLSPRWKRTTNHPLNRKYSVVLTNPPYLGRKLIDRTLKLKLKKYFPDCASDLSQIFLWKALELVPDGGAVGFLTQSSFMHLPSAIDLRKRILEQAKIDLVIELGDGVFPLLAGSKADSSIIFLSKSKASADEPAYYLDLRIPLERKNKESKLEHLNKLSQIGRLTKTSKTHGELSTSHDLAFNFKRPGALFLVQAKSNQSLASTADFKQGLATSDNEKFLRFAWEIEESDKTYVPYAKGGGSERWWRTITSKVRWGEDGSEIKAAVAQAYPYLKGQIHWVVKNENYYFRPGLTFSFVNRHRLSVRRLPPGAIFDVGGSAIFSHEADQENLLLAYLNSSLVSALAHDLNPTINFQIGDLKRLPLIQFSDQVKQQLTRLAHTAVDTKQQLEPLLSPAAHLLNSSGSKLASLSHRGFAEHLTAIESYQRQLIAIEEEIDRLVLSAAGSHFSLDQKDQLELSQWVEERAKADTSAGAVVKLTSKIFFENQLAQAFAKRLGGGNEQFALERPIAFNDVAVFLNNKIEIEAGFADQFVEGNLYKYFASRFNQVLHEQYGGQPPALAIEGAIQATLPLTRKSGQRPSDLYRLLD